VHDVIPKILSSVQTECEEPRNKDKETSNLEQDVTQRVQMINNGLDEADALNDASIVIDLVTQACWLLQKAINAKEVSNSCKLQNWISKIDRTYRRKLLNLPKSQYADAAMAHLNSLIKAAQRVHDVWLTKETQEQLLCESKIEMEEKLSAEKRQKIDNPWMKEVKRKIVLTENEPEQVTYSLVSSVVLFVSGNRCRSTTREESCVLRSTKESVEKGVENFVKAWEFWLRRNNTQCIRSAVPGTGKVIRGLKASPQCHY
jgi:hypothetical protein